jgi:hypothetical protein
MTAAQALEMAALTLLPTCLIEIEGDDGQGIGPGQQSALFTIVNTTILSGCWVKDAGDGGEGHAGKNLLQHIFHSLRIRSLSIYNENAFSWCRAFLLSSH